MATSPHSTHHLGIGLDNKLHFSSRSVLASILAPICGEQRELTFVTHTPLDRDASPSSTSFLLCPNVKKWTNASFRFDSRMDRSRLLELPVELRLEIFEHLLQQQGSLTVGGCYSPSFLQFSVPPAIFGGDLKLIQAQQPAITLVSRQIRNETLSLFYRQNRFLLALHYRRARLEVSKFLDAAERNKKIGSNLHKITVKHRFGILDFRGTIDFDLRTFSILGPHLWYNSIPPIYIKEIEDIVNHAREAERTDSLVVDTLRRLVEVLGVAMSE